jgi:branched-chain amino acid aminotransferase
VGTLLHNDIQVQIGAGAVGPNTRRLRQALIDVQRGQVSDHSGWTDPVDR